MPECSAGPACESDLAHWIACLTGPEDTPFAGGNFVLELDFGKEYPALAPKVRFATRIYHPNINAGGNVCLDLLKDKREPSRTVPDILLAVRSLLIDPNPDDPLVPEIAMLYKMDKAKYESTARDWTRQYAT